MPAGTSKNQLLRVGKSREKTQSDSPPQKFVIFRKYPLRFPKRVFSNPNPPRFGAEIL
jgi:hypothetical protein